MIYQNEDVKYTMDVYADIDFRNLPIFIAHYKYILEMGLRKCLYTYTIRFRNDSHTQTHREII